MKEETTIKISETSIGVVPPQPEPTVYTKEQIISTIATIDANIQLLQDTRAIQEKYLADCEKLGIKTQEEIDANL